MHAWLYSHAVAMHVESLRKSTRVMMRLEGFDHVLDRGMLVVGLNSGRGSACNCDSSQLSLRRGVGSLGAVSIPEGTAHKYLPTQSYKTEPNDAVTSQRVERPP